VKSLGRRARTSTACASIALAGILAMTSPVYGQDQTKPSAATASDNTAANAHHQMTADQQTNAAGDRTMTAQIRKSIIADKALSTYAHNVKIITVNGMVTLKGPVTSDEEKQNVADLAAKVAGADKVTNKITVKQQRP
jgi:hyperosmotically inducible protein